MIHRASETGRRLRPGRGSIGAVVAIVLAGLLVGFALLTTPASAQDAAQFEVDAPSPALEGIEQQVVVSARSGQPSGDVALSVGGTRHSLTFDEGEAVASVSLDEQAELQLLVDGTPAEFVTGPGSEAVTTTEIDVIPGWLSIIPPIAAIALALLTRRVIPALLLGIWVAAWFVRDLSLAGIWFGLLDTLDRWVVQALAPPDGDTGRVSILVFTILIGGLTGIISRNGGAQGLVDRLTPWARNRRRGLVTSSGVGTGLFFDDYAGMLVTGNSMRPVTDRLRISREKLAYIVDTTASPLATLALVTTWIGFQVGLIGDATAELDEYPQSAYGTFLQALPYMYYPLLAVVFMWLLTATGRDFGPMAKAERRALEGDPAGDGADEGGENALAPDEDIPKRMVNAMLPISVLIGVVLGALYVTGEGSSLTDIVGSADPYAALMWGSLLSVLVAAGLSMAQGLLSLGGVMSAWMAGFKAVIEVLVILALAWALSDLTEALGTAAFLTSLLGEGLPAGTLPAVLFVLTAAVAFATGTSWGAMGILLPLSVPLTWSVLGDAALADGVVSPVFYAAVAATVAGAVWGDHASPISDTTVLSAATSGCDVVSHTRTQIPYALVVGAVAAAGLLVTGLGVAWWLVLPGATALLVALVVVVASRPDVDGTEASSDASGPGEPDKAETSGSA